VPKVSRVLSALLALPLALAACTSEASDGAAATETTVAVTLADDAVTLEPVTVPAGAVRLAATNEGTMTHEFEIFAGATTTELPVESNVAVTEGLELVDEVEDVVPGATGELVLDLDPGTYLVICNLPGHYAAGMKALLTVE